MWQTLVESQARRSSQNEDDLIERLNLGGTFERPSHDPETGGVNVASSIVMEGLAIAPNDSPVRVVLTQVPQGALQVRQPLLGRDYVLVQKNNQIVVTLLDRLVIRLRRRGIPLLDQELMWMRLAETRRRQEVILEYLSIIHCSHECNRILYC